MHVGYFNLHSDPGLFPSRTLANPLLICSFSVSFHSLLLGCPLSTLPTHPQLVLQGLASGLANSSGLAQIFWVMLDPTLVLCVPQPLPL